MQVTVKKIDIKRGRFEAGSTCGCPIWHALNRQFGLGLTEISNRPLKVPSYTTAKLGRYLKLLLPPEAVEFQQILRAAPNAKVEPFTFEAEVITL